MIIDYRDGTSVTLQLGDLDSSSNDPDMCWFKVNNNGWMRSPFTTCDTTKRYLLSLQSANQIHLDDIPSTYKAKLR